ncbi:hypothetical protein OFK41_13500 [Acinetobacter baumannii]|uniref:hypothetical protein n=1 Tax=Acinetobacter baumannii TaxID=470 RepID=UPI002253B9D0|nr:hypothetical protein [Acinetobacter baumannii]MCX3035218.1 hypothetical protein [Acinetobacter baumannii]
MQFPQINWFDMSEMGVYLAPELICGKSCILLLDKKNIFTHKDILNGRLEENGFLRVDFVSSENSSVYILFTNEITTDFFLTNLCMPKDQIYTFDATLKEIQNIFYDQAEHSFNKRIEVFIKSSLMLGYNSESEEVHKSNFGRFKISKTDEGEKITTESIKEPLVSFLRAESFDDVFMCSKEYIKNAVENKKNISSLDIKAFGRVIYEIDGDQDIRPSQVFNIIDCFNANYVMNFSELCIEKKETILSDFRIYKKICLTYEASSSYPSGIQSIFLENNHTTPPPLAIIMQKLLLNNANIDHETKILNPMSGLGSLITVLSAKGSIPTCFEVNPKKNILFKKIDSLNSELLEQDFLSISNDELGVESYDYVISSPAYGVTDSYTEFKDSFGSLLLNRIDLICLMKSLILRKPKGRSVFLVKKGDQVDFNSLIETFNFINARYVIEGISVISKEIHSKSILGISTILIVISDKRAKHLKDLKLSDVDILKTRIFDYESLWDWSDFVNGKNNEKIKNINFILDHWDQLNLDIKVSDDMSGTVLADEELIDPIGIGDDVKKGFSSVSLDGNSFSKFESFGNSEIDNKKEESTPTNELIDTSTKDDIGGGQDDEENSSNTENEITIDHAKSEDEASIDSDLASSERVKDQDAEFVENSLSSAINYFKENNNIKIARKYSDFFNLTKRSEIIRSHSISTISDTTTNVLLSDFSSYLKGKEYVKNILDNYFSDFKLGEEQVEIINEYEYKLKVESYIEKYILSKIDVQDQVAFTNVVSSETIDLLASFFIHEKDKKSIVFSNNNNLNSLRTIALSSNYFFKKNKTIVFIAKSKKTINALLSEIDYISEVIFKAKFKVGIVDDENISIRDCIEQINKGENSFLIIYNKKEILTLLKNKEITDRFLKLKNTVSILETDFTEDKYESRILKHLFNEHMLFLTDSWINHKTPPQLIKAIFKETDFNRFFAVNGSSVTDMTAYLAKKYLIETYQFFQLYENYSDIRCTQKLQNNLGENFEYIMNSYSNILNKIAILSEDIYRNLPQNHQVKNNNIYNFRIIILEIYHFIEHCLSSIPLIYNTFTLAKKNIKPIIVIPKNIENTLFNIFEKLNITSIRGQEKISLTEMNQEIDYAIRNNESPTKIDELLSIRNNSIISYLKAHNKVSSGQPNTVHLVSACLYFCLVDFDSKHKNYNEILNKIKKIENEIENLLELPICYPDFVSQELAVNKIKCGEASSRLFKLAFNEKSGEWESKNNIFSNKIQSVANDFNSGKFDAIIVEKECLEVLDLSSKVRSSSTSDHLRKRAIIFTYVNKSVDHYICCINAVHKKGQLSPPDVILEVAETPINTEIVKILKDQFQIFNININDAKNQKHSLSYFLNEKGNKLIEEYINNNPHYKIFVNNEEPTSIVDILSITSLVNHESQIDFINQMYTLKSNNEKNEQETKCNPFNLIVVSSLVNKNKQTFDNSPYYLLRGSNDNSSEVNFTSLEYIKETSSYFTSSRFKTEFELSSKAELIDNKNTISLIYQSLLIPNNDIPEGLDKLYSEFYEVLSSHVIKVFQDRIHNTLNNRYKKWIYKNSFIKMDQLKSIFVGNQGLKISNTLNNIYIECLMIGDKKLISDLENVINILTFISCYLLTLKDLPNGKFISIPVSSPFNDRSDIRSQGALLQFIPPKNLALALDQKSYLLKVCYSNKSKPTYLTLDYVLKNSSVLKNKSVLQEITPMKEKLILSVYKEGINKILMANKISRLNVIGVSDFKTVSIDEYFSSNNNSSTLKRREINVLTNNIFLNYQLLKEYCPLSLTSFNDENGITKYGLALPPEYEISQIMDILVKSCSIQDLELIVDDLINKKSIRYLSNIEVFGDFGSLKITGFKNELLSMTFSGNHLQMDNLFLKSNLISNTSASSENSKKIENTFFNYSDFQDFSNNGTQIFKVNLKVHELKLFMKTIAKKGLYRTALVNCQEDYIRRKLEVLTS